MVDVYSVSSLQVEAIDEVRVSGCVPELLKGSSKESMVYKVMQGSSGDKIGMYITFSVLLC